MTTPESLAATLPNMTLAEVRDRLALGQTPARIRAESRLLAEGLPVLDGLRAAGLIPDPPPLPIVWDAAEAAAHTISEAAVARMVDRASDDVALDIRARHVPHPLASSVALAFHDHNATLRALAEQERIDRLEALRKLYERNPITREAFERSIAEQEREDAPALVARLYEAHIRARVKLEDLLRIGSKTEAEALAIHEARLLSDRTHRAHEQAEHDLLGAARYGEAWPEKRASYMRNGVGPHAPPLESIEVSVSASASVTAEPADLGSMPLDVARRVYRDMYGVDLPSPEEVAQLRSDSAALARFRYRSR